MSDPGIPHDDDYPDYEDDMADAEDDLEEDCGLMEDGQCLKAGSPKAGDMIAVNIKNPADKWLVAAAYFADNFEPV